MWYAGPTGKATRTKGVEYHFMEGVDAAPQYWTTYVSQWGADQNNLFSHGIWEWVAVL